jgi:hypothetical protein
MALVHRARQPYLSSNRDEVVEERPAGDVVARDNYGVNVLSRIVWLVAGIILLLLAFRFVLSLLGANPGNSFANFIYNTSHPFVSPFFGLFHYNNFVYGAAPSEIYTLVAMGVYAAIAWILSAALNVGRRY